MFKHPEINPVIFQIYGPLQVRWYGLMYVVAIVSCLALMMYRERNNPNWSTDKIIDLAFYMALGIVIGGRLGYMFFYAPDFIYTNPLRVFKLWEGGMSFHGGIIGVGVAAWLFARRFGVQLLSVMDAIAPVIPVALGFGRLGNFINGELWGKITTVPWGMYFYHIDIYPRHPWPIYAILLEGVLLALILWWYARKPRQLGANTACFLMGYGLIRIFEEFFREPDAQYGYLWGDWLTMGQVLCLPMLLMALYLWFGFKGKNNATVSRITEKSP